MIVKQKDYRQESIILRQDWIRKRENMERQLRQLDIHLSQATSSSEVDQIKAKAALIEKTFRKHLEEQERSLRSLEKNGCLLDRERKVSIAYKKVLVTLQWFQYVISGILSPSDITELDTEDLFGQISDPLSISEDTNAYQNAFFLESILTDWQMAAARIIERELLIPRRIGSLCFFSGQNALLGMKLSFMLRVGLVEPDKNRGILCTCLKNAWTARQVHFRLLIEKAHFRSPELVAKYNNVFDALFLDYEILRFWAQESAFHYMETISDLEPAFPFLILLLTENQVASHVEALRHMNVEIHPLYPRDHDVLSEDVSTLLIARRRSRYILHYASEPWDVSVKDFSWHQAQSLKQPFSRIVTDDFPNPFHLSEKILLTSEFTARVTNILTDTNNVSAVVSTQREAACWRKFGEQIPEIPRLVSEETTDRERKIILFLGKGNWTFARKLQLVDLLEQTYSLLRLLSWFRKRSLFLNHIRTDTIAVDGAAIRLLSLERLGSQETEDTISSLLWFWHDVANPMLSLRAWPVEYFPEKNLSKIPEPLQKIARTASSAPNLDVFLNNLPDY